MSEGSPAAGGGTPIPPVFARYPGALLVLDSQGVVVDSNGALERESGATLIGTPFADALDAESSRRKLERLLAQVFAEGDGGGGEGSDGLRPGSSSRPSSRAPSRARARSHWELILAGSDSLGEPRAFVPICDREAGHVWLVEELPDPHLDDLRDRVAAVNSDLAGTQRELLKERARLARALEDLRARGNELERSNEALDEFAHVVSHDLKAPLRGIVQYAEWLQEDIGGTIPAESRLQLERLHERAKQLSGMITGILAYARAGRDDAPPERVDVGELVRGVVEILGPLDGVDVTVAPGMPTLLTERAPLRQVFMNLVANAIRHADPAAPRVWVSARKEAGGYEFAVADNGPGVPPERRESVWELFATHGEQHSAPGAGAGAGTGIGLAVVRKIVKQHGGSAWVEDGEDGGAVFRFTWAGRGAGRPSSDPKR